jgi:uncharacterized protein YdhG (YjbR/CyaY superfamily)
MKNNQPNFSSIDEYIANFPPDIQAILHALRATIRAAAPEAEEKISYQLPTYFLKGNLVHFAAFKNHIGFYPAPSGIGAFQQEPSAYKSSKGAVQFPIDEPLPLELVGRIVQFRVRENLEKAAQKKDKSHH